MVASHGAAPVPGFDSRGRVPLWFALAFVAAGAVAVLLGVGLLRDELRLVAGGTTTVATVRDLTRQVTDDSRTYRVVYRFETRTQGSVEGSSQVDPATFAALRIGDRVRVTYLPDEPAVNRLGEPTFQPFPSLLALLVGIVILAAGLGLTWSLWAARRAAAQVGAGSGSTGSGGAGSGGARFDPAMAARLPPADPDGVRRFRPSGRFAIFGVILSVAGGGAAFVAAWLAFVATRDPIPVVIFSGGGLVCLWLAITTARRARGPAALELLSGGLRTPASGLLRWEDLREVRLEDVSLSRTEPGAVPLRRLGIVPVAPVPDERRWTDLPMQGVYRALSWLGPTLRAFRAGTVGEVPELTSLAPFGALESDLGVPLEAIVELIASRVPVVDAKGRLLRHADALFWPERELLDADALEPEPR